MSVGALVLGHYFNKDTTLLDTIMSNFKEKVSWYLQATDPKLNMHICQSDLVELPPCLWSILIQGQHIDNLALTKETN